MLPNSTAIVNSSTGGVLAYTKEGYFQLKLRSKSRMALTNDIAEACVNAQRLAWGVFTWSKMMAGEVNSGSVWLRRQFFPDNFGSNLEFFRWRRRSGVRRLLANSVPGVLFQVCHGKFWGSYIRFWSESSSGWSLDFRVVWLYGITDFWFGIIISF